jgi:SAM-dependent methyltransferase
MTTRKTADMVASLRAEDEDFEWYPTTAEMINVIVADAKRWSAELDDVESVLDIGAGDGRVLALFRALWPKATYLSIEKSSVLQASQPDWVVPAGTDFREQDLMSVQAGVVFCNPPYSEFEAWAARIIAEAFCRVLYLIIPQRWVDSGAIKQALASRNATAIVLKSTDFLRADRSARARVDIIRVEFAARRRRWREETPDPFDAWFSANVSSFDEEQAVDETVDESRLVRLRDVTTIPALVAEFDLDYARMQGNYQAIFRLDAALLRELGVQKDALCTAVKTRIAGLKRVYWRALFDRLSSLTTRLATKTRAEFLERLTGRNAIAFTVSNCYSIVMWAIRHADAYFDQQVIDLFFELSQREGVTKYVSNKRTWGDDAWRYSIRHDDPDKRPSHYRLDYRFVVPGYSAIGGHDFGAYDFPGGLHRGCHALIDDIIAVLSTLGFSTPSPGSMSRQWHANMWKDWLSPDGELLFQVKGFNNGNLHMRFAPAAIMALNVEAGRLLGWLKSPAEAATELGATQEQTERAWRSIAKLDATKTLALVSGGGCSTVPPMSARTA